MGPEGLLDLDPQRLPRIGQLPLLLLERWELLVQRPHLTLSQMLALESSARKVLAAGGHRLARLLNELRRLPPDTPPLKLQIPSVVGERLRRLVAARVPLAAARWRNGTTMPSWRVSNPAHGARGVLHRNRRPRSLLLHRRS